MYYSRVLNWLDLLQKLTPVSFWLSVFIIDALNGDVQWAALLGFPLTLQHFIPEAVTFLSTGFALVDRVNLTKERLVFDVAALGLILYTNTSSLSFWLQVLSVYRNLLTRVVHRELTPAIMWLTMVVFDLTHHTWGLTFVFGAMQVCLTHTKAARNAIFWFGCLMRLFVAWFVINHPDLKSFTFQLLLFQVWRDWSDIFAFVTVITPVMVVEIVSILRWMWPRSFLSTDQDWTCAICLAGGAEDPICVRLDCRHLYHLSCFSQVIVHSHGEDENAKCCQCRSVQSI